MRSGCGARWRYADWPGASVSLLRTAPKGQAGMQIMQPRQRLASMAGCSPRSICTMARVLHASRAWQMEQVWQVRASMYRIGRMATSIIPNRRRVNSRCPAIFVRMPKENLFFAGDEAV
jgi:hypothetical protein